MGQGKSQLLATLHQGDHPLSERMDRIWEVQGASHLIKIAANQTHDCPIFVSPFVTRDKKKGGCFAW